MLVFEIFPEGIVISEHARIRILTLRVRWKWPRVGQIWSQMKKLIFLEIWDVPWRMAMATIRRGTFICMQPPIAKSDRRHGACNFGDESTVSPRRLLLRHMQDR